MPRVVITDNLQEMCVSTFLNVYGRVTPIRCRTALAVGGGPAGWIRAALCFEKCGRPARQPTMYLARPWMGGILLALVCCWIDFALCGVKFELSKYSKNNETGGKMSKCFSKSICFVHISIMPGSMSAFQNRQDFLIWIIFKQDMGTDLLFNLFV